jgi:hypothetical protein
MSKFVKLFYLFRLVIGVDLHRPRLLSNQSIGIKGFVTFTNQIIDAVSSYLGLYQKYISVFIHHKVNYRQSHKLTTGASDKICVRLRVQ